MKKFTILLASLAVMASSVPAFAGKDRIITVGELPAVAQQFVQTHFKAVEVSYAKVDEELFDKDYKVVFVNGSKVEFAKDGAWKEVDCKYGEVPAAIVPQQIRDYVAKNFAGRKIVSIDRDKRDWEVKLDNGLDLKFDLQFRLIEDRPTDPHSAENHPTAPEYVFGRPSILFYNVSPFRYKII